MFNNCNHNLHYWHKNKFISITSHLLLYVLMKFWCKLPEEWDNAKIYRNKKRSLHLLQKCAFFRATEALMYQNARNECSKSIIIWLAFVGMKSDIGSWRDEQQFVVLLMVGAEENDDIDDGVDYVMWRFLLFIVYWVILRWMSEGRSHVQCILRTGRSWRISWAPFCCCNSVGDLVEKRK